MKEGSSSCGAEPDRTAMEDENPGPPSNGIRRMGDGMARNEAQQEGSPAAGDLTLLVTTEQELEQRLRSARDQARQIIEAAETEAQALREAFQVEVDERRARLRAEAETESRARVAEVAVEETGLVARFEELPQARLDQLAEILVTRLLAGEDR